MPKSRPPYPPEFRQRIIELAQADRDAGQRSDGLTTDEREELRRLRRENKTLREETRDPKKRRGLVCQGAGSIPSKDSSS